MSESTRNFHAHGGNQWVVGGKLTFLPGATVEGAEGLFDLPVSSGIQVAYHPPSSAGTVSALREDFNNLLLALQAAGVMARKPELSE